MAAEKPAVEDHQPQFFRVLLPGFSTKLDIPRAFAKHIKKEKLETATILSPLGMPWRVRVEGDIPTSLYFGEGWPEFVRAHDLELGYFMVFHHLGRMVFSLDVFDLSCCEKEYYHNKPDVGGGGGSGGFVIKNKKIKREENPNLETVVKIIGKCHSESDGQWTRGTTSSCTQRFQYTVGSSLCQMKSIRVPSAFKATSGISSKDEVILRDPEKRLFPVRLLHTTNKRTLFRKGWREFYLSNDLKTGDVCEFQYSPDSKEKNIMQVDIFKQSTRPWQAAADSNEKDKAKAANPSTPLQTPKSTKSCVMHPASEAPNSMATRTSCYTGRFRLTVTRAYADKPFMNIPVAFSFAASSILSLQQVILEDPEGRLCPVRVFHITRYPNQSIFTTGWKEFYVSNNLKLGDTLEFQYPTDSKEENNIMKVQIFNQSTMPRQPGADCNEKTKRKSENPPMNSQRQKPTKKHVSIARNSMERFSLTVTPPYVNTSSINIPAACRGASRILSLRHVILRDPKGRLFPVRIYHGRKHLQKHRNFSTGWREFYLGNDLKPGDTCEFQLVADSDEEKMVQVCIIRG